MPGGLVLPHATSAAARQVTLGLATLAHPIDVIDDEGRPGQAGTVQRGDADQLESACMLAGAASGCAALERRRGCGRADAARDGTRRGGNSSAPFSLSLPSRKRILAPFRVLRGG